MKVDVFDRASKCMLALVPETQNECLLLELLAEQPSSVIEFDEDNLRRAMEDRDYVYKDIFYIHIEKKKKL